MTQEELLSVAEIIERQVLRFENQGAEYERKLAEHRASFGARTEADAKIIEGLRVARTIIDGQRASIDDLRNRLNSLGIQAAKQAGEALGMVAGEGLLGAALRVVKERDGLLAQVQDQRAEFASALSERDALRVEVAALQERLRASIARGDFAQMEVAQLKAQTPQHPVKVGEWVRRTDMPSDQTPVGFVKQVTAIDCDGERYHFSDGDYWSIDNCEPCAHQHPAQDGQWVRRTVASGTEPVGTMIQVQRSRTLHEEYVTPRGGRVVPWAHCEPCDPPEASHDTPAGKEAAEAVIRDSQMTAIKVGDVVEVFQSTRPATTKSDIGAIGIVTEIIPGSDSVHEHVVLSDNGDPATRLPFAGMASLCDVRKVPQ